MPKPLVNPSTVISQTIGWDEIRKAIRRCILEITPNARVYSSWPLKYDIRQTINLLQSEAENNRIHCWMVSVNEATPTAEKTGGYFLRWELNIRIWGFVGYKFDHDDSTQDLVEEEAKKISQILYLNQKDLGMDLAQGLEVGLLAFDDIDVHGFGSGADVHVAQGNITIKVSETFSL